MAGWLYCGAIFRFRTTEKLLILTFDDGPNPDSTPQLLEILGKNNVKVIFFCDGSAAERYPDLIRQIISEGHMIGNHGYGHLNGWRTNTKDYMNDISMASDFTSYKILRPPYGKLSFSQFKRLSESYKIVFWDIMPYDFDVSFGREKSLKILKKRIRPGSIIVLHDTPSSSANSIIEEFLIFSESKGYEFRLSDFA